MAHILLWSHQRYTSLDSHYTVGALTIYIPGLAFYSWRTGDIHPYTVGALTMYIPRTL